MYRWLLSLAGALFLAGIGCLAEAQVGQIPDWPPKFVTAGAPAYTGSGNALTGATEYYALFAYTSALRGNAVISLCSTATGANLGCADASTDATSGIVSSSQTRNSIVCGTTAGVNTCGVNILRGQLGLDDATAHSFAEQALFVPNCLGTIPCLRAPAGGAYYVSGVSHSASNRSLTGACTHSGTAPAGNERILAWGSASELLGENTSSVSEAYSGVSFATGSTMTAGTFYALTGTWNSTSGTTQIYTNGSAGTSTTGAVATGTIAFEVFGNGGTDFIGDCVEWRIDSTELSSGNASTLSSNMRSRGGY